MSRCVTLMSAMLILLLAAAGPAAAREADDSFLAGFVAGDYVLIGKAADNGAAYAGTARLSGDGSKLRLERRVDGSVQVAEGAVEVPHPPGEGSVLRFRWTNGEEIEVLTCLVSSDLDNYARLTCVRVTEGHDHAEPGLEALFPTAAWPESSPSRQPDADRADAKS